MFLPFMGTVAQNETNVCRTIRSNSEKIPTASFYGENRPHSRDGRPNLLIAREVFKVLTHYAAGPAIGAAGFSPELAPLPPA